MPIYEYECKRCGKRFELQQNFGSKPKKRCPECRGKLQKVFSPVGIVFKGSGFYCTDSQYKSRGCGSDKKNDETAKSCERTDDKTCATCT